jgi:LacI family transcriptional regulator
VTAIDDPLVVRAVDQMHARMQTRPNVAEIAATLGFSRRLLELRFRKALGRSPLQELHRIRATAIGQTLAEGCLSIRETAARFGYPDVRQFSREFRRHAGRSPSAFLRYIRSRLR